jgi:hypothetical protein
VAGVSGYEIVTAQASAALPIGGLLTAKATCSQGKSVVGGGVTQTQPAATTPSLRLMASYPDTAQSWTGTFRNGESFPLGSVTLTVYAICASAN